MFVVWMILAVVVVLAAVVLVRTLRFAPGAAPAVPQGEETIDRDKAVENLRTLIRCRTVSNTNHALEDDAEFEKLCGSPLQSDPEPKKGAFTMEHSTMELKDISAVMMQMFKGTEATIAKSFGGKADYSDPTFKMMVMSGADAPLRAAVLSSCGMFPANLAEGMLALANGHPLNGVKKLIKK